MGFGNGNSFHPVFLSVFRQKSHRFTSGKIDTNYTGQMLIPFPLRKTFPNTVGWLFYFPESTGVFHMEFHSHLPYKPQSSKMLTGNYPLLLCFWHHWVSFLCSIFAHVVNPAPWKWMRWGPVVLCYVRGNCAHHIFKGEGCLLKRAGGSFCESQQGNPVWKTSHSCWLLMSCPQSTDNARHMMYRFYSLKKKGNKPPWNCKLGYIFFRHCSCNKFSSVLFMRNQWLL